MKVSKNTSGAVTFLAPDFALISDNIEMLVNEIGKCLETGELRLVIDFESVPYIDSAGLEKLLECHNEVTRKGGVLKISNPNPLCNEILTITRITDYFDIYFDLEKAGRSFA